MKKVIVLWTLLLTVGVWAAADNNRSATVARSLTKSTNAEGVVKDKLDAEAEISDLNFNGTELDLVLEVYSKLVKRSVLKDPSLPAAKLTLASHPGQKLTLEEKVEALEVLLEMNGVHLEPYGKKFVRALPSKEARQTGIPLFMNPTEAIPETATIASVMIPFKNIATDEAQKALEGFKSKTGLLQIFERTNSILVTDLRVNINRMIEIAQSIDIASPVLENVFVEQIKNASANDIKTVLDNIVQDSLKRQEQEKGSKAQQQTASGPQYPGPFGQRTLFGRSSSGQPSGANNANQAAAKLENIVTSVSDADRGMIRGNTLVLADERSNKLIIVTQKSNMDFFRKVIEQLDVETSPDVKVEVIRLKYADAEDVSDMINDLIGNASNNRTNGKQNQNQASKSGTGANLSSGTTMPSVSRMGANQRSGESKAGELSKENVTVLADKRINGLVVMARTEDMPTIHQIIESMDVKLSQVLIETVIVEVGLGDDLSTGIDWVHGIQQKGDAYRQGLAGGGGTLNPGMSQNASTVSNSIIQATAKALPAILSPGSSGLSYALFSEKLDLNAIIQASKGDSRAKYLASPIVMTVDNKEATIEATQMRYLLKGYTSTSSYYGTATPDYEQKEIGLTVKVTPKINPNGTVMLQVEEEYSQVGEDQQIEATVGSGTGGQSTSKVNVPTTITRKMSADISLENRQTVVLGGLTETSMKESESGIPILKDIPWIGKYLFGSTTYSEARKELLVFMTPYVLEDGDAAEIEALRRKQSLSDTRSWEDHGWSDSKLADPVSAKERLRKQQDEWRKEDEDYKAEQELKKAQEKRKELVRRIKEKAEQDKK